jgi:hypothetical protein
MGIIAGGKYPPNEGGPISGRSKRIVIAALAVSCLAILLMELVADEFRGWLYRKSEPLFFGVRLEFVIYALIVLIVISLTTAIVIGVKQTIRSGKQS